MKKVIVTTSWDDGHKLDLQIATLLKKYRLQGTFYISPQNQEFTKGDFLTNSEVKKLSREFEVGAHTMTHPRLPHVSVFKSNKEIKDSKAYLEKVIGKKIVSFCYPGGKYNKTHVRQIKKAGYKMARTTKTFATGIGNKLFETPTTVHIYNHWTDAWRVLTLVNFNPIAFMRTFRHWDILATKLFDQIEKQGGVFHIWGHSWEVDKNGDWERLEKVFQHIGNKKEVSYKTNGGLV